MDCASCIFHQVASLPNRHHDDLLIKLLSQAANVEHGDPGRLLDSVLATYKRDGLVNGKTFMDIYNQV